MELRCYQNTLVDQIRKGIKEYEGPMLCVAPTGAGKTNIFCYISSSASSKGHRVTILVHRQELIKQTCKTLTAWGVEHGVIAAGWHPRRSPLVQVASIQSLVRREIPPSDIVIVDEAHHTTARTWLDVLRRFDDAYVCGFSATPCRMTGTGLGEYFKRLIMGPRVSWLIQEGYLVRPVCYSIQLADTGTLTARAGDYKIEDMAAMMNQRRIVGDAVQHYREHLDGKPAIVFCVNVQHAENMAEAYRQAGYRAASVDGSLDTETRERRIQGLGNGHTQVLTSCDLVSEGLDIPIVAGCQLLRPTKSTALYLQQVGRVLRPAEGKKHAIVLDHVGNVHKHNLPDLDRNWSLQKGLQKVKDSSEEMIHCPQCSAVLFTPIKQCPHCGFEFKTEKTEMPIATVDGSLTLVTPEEMAALLARANESGRMSDYHAFGKAKYAAEGKPYKPGFGFHLYQNHRGRRHGAKT